MSDVTKHECHICNSSEQGLRHLGDDYASNSVYLLCGDCVKEMTDTQEKIRQLMRNQECRLLKLFLRKQRTNRFKWMGR